MAYIGLDVGTSGCKAAVISESGSILTLASREYSFVCPLPGYVELDPQVVWGAVVSVLQEIAAAGHDLKMIAVSAIGEAMVMMDKQDKTIGNVITYLDRRCSDIVHEIGDRIDLETLHAITGVPLNQTYSLNKYIWLERNQPEVLERADKIFLFVDFLTYKLSGERVVDPSSASRTMFFDVIKMEWSPVITGLFGIPIDKFSKVILTGSIVGTIRRELADEIGLPADLKVIMGCHDQCAASLGSGTVLAGDIMAGEGSTESINLIINKKDISGKFCRNHMCYEPYVGTDQYQTAVSMPTHGTSIRWFVNEFGADFGNCEDIPGENIFERANRGCADDSGEVIFLPYLSRASFMDEKDTALGGFLGLDVNIDKSRMYRALLEGLCFESRLNFELIQSMGLKINKIVASGGCSKSALYMQMKSDILQQQISIPENPEAGVMGLAILCAKADGIFAGYEDAVTQFVKIGNRYSPQREYISKYKKYCMASKAIKELYKEMP